MVSLLFLYTLSHITADQIDAKIGDDVKIKLGQTTKTYTVSAINQGMNNMGEAVRFHPDEQLDYHYAAGSFGIQVNYKDSPDKETLAARKTLLEQQYPDAKSSTGSKKNPQLMFVSCFFEFEP